jgi:hypothetical protein
MHCTPTSPHLVMKVTERASPRRSRHTFLPANTWKVYMMTPPATMPPPTAPRARKCVGGFCDNACRHATPPPTIPTPFRLQTCGGVCNNTRGRHATPARPSRPPPACNAWGRLRQRPPPHHHRHPSCPQTHKGCMRQRPATTPPDTPLKHLGVYALSRQFTHKHINTLLSRKCGEVYATTPAVPRPSSPSRSQTREGVCDRAPPCQPRHATPPRLQPLALANAWGCLRQCAVTPAPPRHAATPPAPRACKRVRVSATGCRHASPATPHHHASNPSRSQTRGGVCDNAPPLQPCHATPPRLQPLALANVWGCLRQRAATPAPPRHAATPPAPRARKCVGVTATVRHHPSPATPRHHTSNPSRSQMRGGVCDNAPPLQPRHATLPPLQPLTLANA